MKLHLTFTKFFVAALFVLGFVLPVTAKHMPQPYKSFDNNYVEWWDEFYQDTDSTQVPVQKAKVEYSSNAAQSQSFDTTVGSQEPDSPENMQDRSMSQKQYDTSWMLLEDW